MSGNPRTLEESRFYSCALGTSRQSSVQLPNSSRFYRLPPSLSSLCVCVRSHIRAATSFLFQDWEFLNLASHSTWFFLAPPNGTGFRPISMSQAYFSNLLAQFSRQLALSTFAWVLLLAQCITVLSKRLLCLLPDQNLSLVAALTQCTFSYSILLFSGTFQNLFWRNFFRQLRY